MMLVQKQPHFPALAPSPYLYTHRRHPSAPPVSAVVVQPTRTPGLLTLSKPVRKEHKSSPKPRQAVPASRSPKPAPAEAVPPLKPAPEIRGRQQHGKRNHQQRSSSHAAPSRRRQPSPDPFKTAAPALPPNKRQPSISGPQPASPVAELSLPDPARRKLQRAATHDIFPICDDMTDVGSRPSTPTPRQRPELRLNEPRTPPRRSRLPEPPLTAPVPSSTALSSFPFPTTSTPNSSPKRRPALAARRTKHLSEGVMLPISFLQETPLSVSELPEPGRAAAAAVCLSALSYFLTSVHRHRLPRSGHPRLTPYPFSSKPKRAARNEAEGCLIYTTNPSTAIRTPSWFPPHHIFAAASPRWCYPSHHYPPTRAHNSRPRLRRSRIADATRRQALFTSSSSSSLRRRRPAIRRLHPLSRPPPPPPSPPPPPTTIQP
uniref:Uncharacterized protein n=1 Tax=Mycena chlorophos TaxID=658473 RepID=A0ABQ0LZ90_MYCCL|nr:predicted protein [Mycena chlorophos]